MGWDWNATGQALGLAGFAFGLFQFWDAQRWKRSEFAARQLERIQSDPLLVTATRVLDWSHRELPVPLSLRKSEAPEEMYFEHTWVALASGIQPESKEDNFTREQVIYRDVFDALFVYFEEVNHYIEIGLIDSKQVRSLKYWLEQVAKPRFGGNVEFGPFLKTYGYPGVLALMAKLAVERPRGTSSITQSGGR